MFTVTELADATQARLLRAELWAHIDRVAEHIEAAERRTEPERSAALRRELGEAYRLVDAIDRRFPGAHSPRQSHREPHTGVRHVPARSDTA